jgi:hypothetical protein
VTFGVQQNGSITEEIDAETVTGLAERAFSRWLASPCAGGTPSLQIGNVGSVICSESRYNEHARNANIVIFRDEGWPYPDAIDTYGFTRVRFDIRTGEIYDADIEINSAEFDLVVDENEEGVDLESILSHEIGHFLGLGHAAPNEDTATMRPGWDGEGTELRTPSADDAEGMCAIYPPGRQAATTSCEPRHGFASDCNVPNETHDAACTLGRRRPSLLGFLTTTAILVLALRRTWIGRRGGGPRALLAGAARALRFGAVSSRARTQQLAGNSPELRSVATISACTEERRHPS